MSNHSDPDSAWLCSTPEVLNGKVRVRGRRLSVHYLGSLFESGADIESLAEKFGVPHSAVSAAITYYREYPDAMEDIDARREQVLSDAESDPSIPTSPDELAR